jgi:ApbE superfamily uncharacterized protein (UPF0280 family)
VAENGPMRIIIQAWNKKKSDIKMASKAAEFSFTCLEQVAQHHEILKQVHFHLPKGLDPVSRAMVESVMVTGEKDSTPMAAVAGSIADAVADWLFNKGMTRVIVNNGGDIAIRIAENETARVGIRIRVKSPIISHVVELSSLYPSWGVNTSGLGGRSLTWGIASAVTAFARTSSLADAAATSIANACFASDDSIVQVMARKVDPNTDIRETLVTIKTGKLKKSCISKALNRALNKAEQYVEKGIIQGTFIAVEDEFLLTHGFHAKIAPLESLGP